MELETYWTLTKRPLLSLWFILPPLLAYHLGALFLPAPMGLRANYDLLRFLRYFGAASAVLPPLLVLFVLGVGAYVRRDRFEFRPRVLGVMVVESLVWAGPLMILGHFNAADRVLHGGRELLASALQSVGAGVYEEFLFRMVFLTAFTAFFVDLLKWRRDAFVTAGVVIGAVLFALYHFLPGGNTFNWGSFIFLTAAGLLWGLAYMTRGFGIAVGSHIAWDIYCVIRMAG
ncbi:MAG: CPBP family intramembrane metalloprotease [Planctomycetota bacterium]|nr:CPBP family intramembrane metalloprotease [Planctomycetota bacterium]